MSCSRATFFPVHRHAMHMTLPVPEHDPQRSPATVTGPLLVFLISGTFVPSEAGAPVA